MLARINKELYACMKFSNSKNRYCVMCYGTSGGTFLKGISSRAGTFLSLKMRGLEFSLRSMEPAFFIFK